jgi:hypothetical protein
MNLWTSCFKYELIDPAGTEYRRRGLIDVIVLELTQMQWYAWNLEFCNLS